MNFEEQFPSLKVKGLMTPSKFNTEKIYYESIIQNYCLDKQKVEDVLTSLQGRKIRNSSPIITKIREELGLDG